MHPLIARHVLYPLHERLKGKRTHRHLRDLERSQWLSPDALRERQFRRLKAHLEFAYEQVPYYRELLDRHDLAPARVASLEDFARIPCLTKDIIRARAAHLTPRSPLRGVQELSTGGSTGTPVTVLVDRERAAVTDATRLRAHRWFDADMGAPEVVVWGSPIEVGRQDRVRQLRDWLLNSTLVSAFDLGPAGLRHCANIVRAVRPVKLFGYASALALLAEHLERSGWTAPPDWPRVVFTTAEPLYPFQRQVIERVFGCPAAVEYGCRDGGLIANECPRGGLHIAAEGILVEIVEGNEIVVTNLHSYAMPIIRYRTGDVGTLDPAPCSCGRGLPLLGSVEGRRTDFLITPDGRVMHALAPIYVLREVASVREFEIVQDRIDRLAVTLVPGSDFSPADRERIAEGLRRLFGPEMTIEIAISDAIVRPSGKHRYVRSTVAGAHLASVLGAR